MGTATVLSRVLLVMWIQYRTVARPARSSGDKRFAHPGDPGSVRSRECVSYIPSWVALSTGLTFVSGSAVTKQPSGAVD